MCMLKITYCIYIYVLNALASSIYVSKNIINLSGLFVQNQTEIQFEDDESKKGGRYLLCLTVLSHNNRHTHAHTFAFDILGDKHARTVIKRMS